MRCRPDLSSAGVAEVTDRGRFFRKFLAEIGLKPAAFARLMDDELRNIQNWRNKGVPGGREEDIARETVIDRKLVDAAVNDGADLPLKLKGGESLRARRNATVFARDGLITWSAVDARIWLEMFDSQGEGEKQKVLAEMEQATLSKLTAFFLAATKSRSVGRVGNGLPKDRKGQQETG